MKAESATSLPGLIQAARGLLAGGGIILQLMPPSREGDMVHPPGAATNLLEVSTNCLCPGTGNISVPNS